MHYSNVVTGLRKYIINELVSPIAGTGKGALVFVVGGLVERRATEIMNWLSTYKPAQITKVVVGENIDTDVLLDLLREYMNSFGGITYKLPKVDLVYTFKVNDVDALERYIKGGPT